MAESHDNGETIEISHRRPRPVATSAPYLTLVKGAGVARSIAVTAEPLVLGRDPSRAFHLADGEVSRSHCAVRRAGDAVLVRDLGSTNGTWIDGERVAGERVLPLGARLQVGGHALRLELTTADEVRRRERLAADLERAHRYVRALLPEPLEHGSVRTEWHLVPSSTLGGDGLGHHDLGDGRLALYLLDVCGHGVRSAMHTASVLNALRDAAVRRFDPSDPSRVLAHLEESFPMERYDGMYFTIWYGVLDPAAQTLRHASAGHPPALLLGRDGRVRERLGHRVPPIGTLGTTRFETAETAFRPGERLYVFSDGVYELATRDGRELGLDDFVRDLEAGGAERAAGEPRRLYDAALERTGADALEDDFTLLVVRHASASGTDATTDPMP